MRIHPGAGSALARAACWTALMASLTVVPARAQVTITEFPVPTAGSRPYTIVAGPDGNLWFTESLGNKIGRITTHGVITEFPVPTPGSGAYGIAVGADRNIWFTERFADQIGRFSPGTGHFTEFGIPTPLAQAWEIAPSADGKLWFTEEDVNQIASVTTAGQIDEFLPGGCCFPTGIAPGADGNAWYTLELNDMIGRIDAFGQTTTFPIPSVQVLAWDITPGPDGNVWFSELAGRAIGRITPTGTVTEFPIPGPFSGIAGVTAGPDGNIWYTENDTDHVGAMDTSGNLLATLDVAGGSRPLSITTGPDGNLWFTEADGNAIGRVNVAPPTGGFVLSMDAGFSPRRRRVGLGETVKWMFVGPRPHSVVDASGFARFDSGPHSMVSYFTHAFGAASTFPYADGVPGPPTATAAITVPVSLPASASVNQPFAVTWSTSVPAPGVAFDVQVALPGTLVFAPWLTSSQAAEDYLATSPGTYRFRARMRDTVGGAVAFYSQPASIPVR